VTKSVVIDANLLVLLIVGMTNPEYIKRHRRLNPSYKAQHFDLIRRILIKALKVVCTTHILTEASNLLRQVGDPMRSEIMATYRMFESAEEPGISAKTASQSPNFIRLGLTDAAILSFVPANMLLLTVDHDLHIAAAERGFETLNLTPYLYE
jgi:hypothetical protein